MVRVYIMNVTGLPDPKDDPEIMDGLSEERKEKILRHARPEGRQQSLGAGLLLQYVLEGYGRSMEEITYGEHGKPEMPGLFFNISHSHEWAVCAVGKRTVGCDIERVGTLKKNVAERFFSEREAAYLAELSGRERDEAFYRIWTMKESYLKMTGEGMQIPLDRVESYLEEPVKVLRKGKRVSCYVKEYDLLGYRLTVCSEDGEFSSKVREISV